MTKSYLVVAILAVSGVAAASGQSHSQSSGAPSSMPTSRALTPTDIAGRSAQFAKGSTPGQEVFNHNCATCHADGPLFAGTVALTTKYAGTLPGPLEKRSDLTPEVVRYFVRNGVSVMPGFRKTQISDKELDELASYLAKKH